VRNGTAEDLHGGLELLKTLPENTEALEALQSMVFLASNHFLDSADLRIRQNIINWLGEEKNAPLLRRLLSVGGPTAESTLEALYPYALHGRSTDVIRIFIDLGCDPNFSYVDRLDSYTSIATTALGSACAGKNLELVCLLLAAGADPNQLSRETDDDELSCPIIISIMEGARERFAAPEEDEDASTLQLVEALTQSGALIHGLSTVRRVPLIQAVQRGNESVVRFLLNKGADANLIDGFEKRPLGSAINEFVNRPWVATSKSLSMVQLLLDAGADLNVLSRDFCYPELDEDDEDGRFVLPFDNAASTGCLPLLELLHAAGARPGCLALDNAILINDIKGGKEDVIKFTLHAITICEDSQVQNSALIQAVQSADSRWFRFLFESSTNRFDSYTLSVAIQKAITQKNYETAQQLLLAGRHDTHFADKLAPAARVAISSGDLEILDLVLGAGVKVNSNLLVQAFECSHEPIIKRLLNLRALQAVEESAEESEDEDKIFLSRFFSRAKCNCGVERAHSKTPLLVAAAGFGNCEIVKHLLAKGARFHGTLPLICAVQKRNPEMVAMLLEAGSPINNSACNGGIVISPLQAAVQTKQSSLVRILLDNGADPEVSSLHSRNYLVGKSHNNRYFDGIEPPLHLAVEQGDSEIAMMLLQAGADINNPQAKYWGRSALTLATRGNNQQMFDLVVAQGTDMLDSTAVVEAVEHQNFPLVKELMFRSREGYKHGENFGYEALCAAVELRSTDMVKLLLSNGISPSKRSHTQTALGVAVDHFEGPATDIVELLLRAGADPNGPIEPSGRKGGTRTALVAAASLGDVALVTLLIKYGADPNAYPKGVLSRSPLQAACEAGKLAVVQLLLDHDVDVNAPAAWHNGGTSLQFAAINGNPEIVVMLLERGTDVDAPAARVNGRTALEGAAENGRLDTVKLLLDAGVRIHGPYERQYSQAIQFAREKGHLSIVRELVAMVETSI
jgi:ankyrin repeat protein